MQAMAMHDLFWRETQSWLFVLILVVMRVGNEHPRGTRTAVELLRDAMPNTQ